MGRRRARQVTRIKIMQVTWQGQRYYWQTDVITDTVRTPRTGERINNGRMIMLANGCDNGYGKNTPHR